MRKILGMVVTQVGVKLVQAYTVVDGNVVDLVCRIVTARCSSKQISLNGVDDMAEIPAGFAISVDVNRLVLDHGCDSSWNNGSINAIRILASAEDVEVALANGMKTVGTGKDIDVMFVDQLGYSKGERGFQILPSALGRSGCLP